MWWIEWGILNEPTHTQLKHTPHIPFAFDSFYSRRMDKVSLCSLHKIIKVICKRKRERGGARRWYNKYGETLLNDILKVCLLYILRQ